MTFLIIDFLQTKMADYWNPSQYPKKMYTLNDVLEHIDFFTGEDEEYPQKTEARIFITPPDEEGNHTDEDSEEEECSIFNINHIGRSILQGEVEYRGPKPITVDNAECNLSFISPKDAQSSSREGSVGKNGSAAKKRKSNLPIKEQSESPTTRYQKKVKTSTSKKRVTAPSVQTKWKKGELSHNAITRMQYDEFSYETPSLPEWLNQDVTPVFVFEKLFGSNFQRIQTHTEV